MRHFSWQAPIDKITHEDVAAVIGGIAGRSQAAHAFKDIRSFFNWCLPRYLKSSPCMGLKPPVQNAPRARVLTEAELAAVWNAAAAHGYPFGSIVKLLLLTGQRRGEIAALRSEWVRGDGILFLTEITKNGREHILPIGQMASSIIGGIKQKRLLFQARGSESAVQRICGSRREAQCGSRFRRNRRPTWCSRVL